MVLSRPAMAAAAPAIAVSPLVSGFTGPDDPFRVEGVVMGIGWVGVAADRNTCSAHQTVWNPSA
ncbi:protein of unknown function [Cyanobium sp. NIES-981]|nr:protein of unknown function [Cyanobium sp. NIES-981]